MSLLQEQLEEMRKQTQGAGVTPEMVATAGSAPKESLLPMPQHWTEKAMEEDGKAKFFGKMLLGGFTGLTPLLFPESIGSKDRYKADLANYYERNAELQDAAALNGIDMTNPSMSDIATMPASMQDFASDVYRGNQGGYMATQADLAGMSYPDFMDLSPESRRWHIRRNASESDRADMDFVAGRQTTDQKAADAKAVARAQADGKAESAAAVTEESRMPQVQDAFDLTTQLLDEDSFRGLYGAIDGRTATVLPESLNAKAKVQRLSDILYMFARGELKGQGQVTEQEAEAARNAQSMISNYLMGDDLAYEEFVRLNKMFGGLLGMKPKDMWRPRGSAEDRIIDLD